MATLGFSTEWPKEMGGGRTWFISKIWKGLIDNNLVSNGDFNQFDIESYRVGLAAGLFPMGIRDVVPKLHTIREDKKNLWVPGRKIHMVVFNRTKNRFQFAPVLKVKSVQRITITHIDRIHIVKVNDYINEITDYTILGGNIPYRLRQLVLNDGFYSVSHFFQWFNEDFTGKIIHWTNLRY